MISPVNRITQYTAMPAEQCCECGGKMAGNVAYCLGKGRVCQRCYMRKNVDPDYEAFGDSMKAANMIGMVCLALSGTMVSLAVFGGLVLLSWWLR